MATNRLYQILRDRIRALFEAHPNPTPEQLAEVERAARAQFAGEASGVARAAPPADAPVTTPAPAALAAGDQSTAQQQMMADCPYCSGSDPNPASCDCTGAGCGDGDCPQMKIQQLAAAPAGAVRLAVSTAAWDGSPGRWPSTEAYCASCLVDANPAGQPKTQALCKLPVRGPDGVLNKNAVEAVNAVMHGGRGGVDLSADDRASVMRRLPGLMREAGIGSVAAEDEMAPVYSALRLDEGSGLPAWQVFHVVGDHGEHPRYGRIEFTREMGDQIIRNHAAGVLGRAVPLDFRHATSLDGEAGGYVDRFQWGRKGDGLPGRPEPTGAGDILYAHFPSYNDVGVRALSQEHYRHQSPEYDRNYQGRHGAVALALAATNNPFLRGLRTLQGREQIPVVLDDGTEEEETMPPESTTPQAQTPPPAATPALTATPPAGSVTLEETVRRLEADLALERATTQAAITRLSAVEQHRHEDNVTAAVERAILSGAPPALANKVGRVLLASRPDEGGTIRLSDDDAAAPVNTYAALTSILEDLPRIRLGSLTTGLGDVRPTNEPPVSLEDQAYEAVKNRQLAAMGVTPPSTNGNGAHA